jgi:hypothetical protein
MASNSTLPALGLAQAEQRWAAGDACRRIGIAGPESRHEDMVMACGTLQKPMRCPEGSTLAVMTEALG